MRSDARPGLRGVRLALALALAVLGVWLVGPYRPWALLDHPTFVPQAGQSHIHTVLVALWWAAAVNAVLAAFLLLTSRLWMRPLPVPPRRPRPRAGIGAGGLALVVLAVILAGALRWPLAHGGVWWDEAWTIRNVIVGKLDPAPDGSGGVDFEPTSWRKTLWYYHAPTNHVAYSVTARLANDAWRGYAGAAPEAFDEFALRLPAFLAALAAVAAIAGLTASLGFPRAAPLAAFLLALHPLHVRHGADARGYSFVVLLTVVGAWLLLRALREGRWRDFLAYGASQALLLWTFPLAIYVPLSLGLAGLAAIVFARDRCVGEKAVLAARFAVANLVAAMGFLQLMAPNLAQAAAFRKEWHDEGALDLAWLRRFWVMIATGMPLRIPRGSDVWFPTFRDLAARRTWVAPTVFGAIPAFALLGLLRALRRGPGSTRAVFVGLAGATALFLLHREIQAFFLLPRFAIFALPALVCALAVGVEGAVSAVACRTRSAGAVTRVGLAAVLAGFVVLVAPMLHLSIRRPPTPSTELVTFLARAGEGLPGGVLRAGLGLGGDAPRVYDPAIVEVDRLSQLEALCARARAEGRPLFVFYAFTTVNLKRLPELFVRVRDTRSFEPVATLPGIDPDLVIHVHRYTGRPLDG